jgi:tetratricopeptide (TPR) repeat protein
MYTEMIRTCCRIAAMLAPLAVATHAVAGMSQDLASCTAAKGLSSAAACTRVMDSGRLPDEQAWIGHFNRGSGYRRGNAYDEALADFDKAVELNPRFARAYQGRALVHDELGEDYKAHADLDRAIELDAHDWSAYYSRATITRGAGDFDGALADLAKAAERAPKKPQIALLRALIQSAKGEPAEARAAINKVIADGKSDASGYYARAVVAFDEQHLDVALADLDRAFAAEDDFAAAHMLKGRILEAQGDKAGARQRYRKALELAPDLFDGRHARAIARDRLKVLGDAATPVALIEPRREPERKLERKAEREPERDSGGDSGRKVGCKRFLPTTGTIIEASCGE